MTGGRNDAVRLVVDTNIMIRALLSPGPARQFFTWAPITHTFVYSPEQILELRHVASRPRLDIAMAAVDELVFRIEHYGDVVQDEVVQSVLDTLDDCRDPDDDRILALALAGSAHFILTEDQDLLVLSPWRGHPILRLFQFLEQHPLQKP